MATIPLNPAAETIIISVRFAAVAGSGIRLRMALDTGASLSTIPHEAAIAIGCDPAKAKKRIEIVTASGVEYVPVVTIPEISLLGHALRNIEVACLNLPARSPVSGLAGLNILRKFDIELLFRKKILSIE